MKMEPIVSSETSAIRTQTPGNYPKRNNLHHPHSPQPELSYCLHHRPSLGLTLCYTNPVNIIKPYFFQRPFQYCISSIPNLPSRHFTSHLATQIMYAVHDCYLVLFILPNLITLNCFRWRMKSVIFSWNSLPDLSYYGIPSGLQRQIQHILLLVLWDISVSHACQATHSIIA